MSGNEEVTKTPICISGLFWHVTITTKRMQIGCKGYLTSEWEAFTDEEISEMDRYALEFWKEHKEKLIALCKFHQD